MRSAPTQAPVVHQASAPVPVTHHVSAPAPVPVTHHVSPPRAPIIEEVHANPVRLRPEVIVEPVVHPRPVPITLERPALRFEPNYQGMIFGVDEEVEIEKCFYEEIEFFQAPEVEEIFEEEIVNTPYGPKMVRGPGRARMARPPLEHDELVQKCMTKMLIAPTIEIGVRVPQVRYINITQIKTGTFEWPVIRKAHVMPRKTVEKTVSIPQIGFVDLCQDHPTTEVAVSIPQVHTVLVEQIVHTEECDVSIPQVHTIWVPIMGDVNIVQHRTKSRRVHLTQEWDCTIKCEDTRVHFLKLPQKDSGVSGTVIKNVNDDQSNICHNCHNSKCSGVGPSLMPFIVDDTPIQTVAPARLETKYVEVIREVPIACPTIPVEVAAEPTEIHHISLGMCPCKAVAVSQPVQFDEQSGLGVAHNFLEEESKGAAFPWWLLPLILLGLLLLSMLLAWLLCAGRKKREAVVAEPVVQESPKKKYVIEKRTKEEDEEEIEREIARQLEQRVKAKSPPRQREVEEVKKVVVEERKEAAAQPTTTVGAGVAQNRPESPGGSQRSAGKRSSRGSGSSKKVVKKRIVKMMKQGKLVAEKEEILDEEGNVIRTEIRKEGFSSGSPARSQS